MSLVKAKSLFRLVQNVGVTAAAIFVLAGIGQTASAQTVSLTAGIAKGGMSCAPSNNGTGHLVCLEYASSGTLIGVSWEAPPAVNGSEAPNTIDTLNPLATPAGTPTGSPGCGPSNDGSGSVVCLVIAKTSSGFTLQGIAFSPPATATATSHLQTLGTEAATATIGNPSCVSANAKITETGGTFGAVVCALVMNGALYGVGFEPHTNTTTSLVALSLGTAFTGNPSCTTTVPNTPGVCAVRQGNTLEGFTLLFNPPNGNTAASLTIGNALSLGKTTVTGDPNCATPFNGKGVDNTFTVTCAVVSGNALLGVSFDPQDKTVSAFQTLGAPPDGGTWTGAPGCAATNDGRTQFQELVSCAVASSTTNLFEVSFDPRGPVSFGINGAFGTNAESSPSCLPLAIDADELYCGATVASGASGGFMLPVGILPQHVSTAVLHALQ
jgi:hypothetical protein